MEEYLASLEKTPPRTSELYRELTDDADDDPWELEKTVDIPDYGMEVEQILPDLADDDPYSRESDAGLLSDGTVEHQDRTLPDTDSEPALLTAAAGSDAYDEAEFKEIEPLQETVSSQYGDVSPSLRERENEWEQEYRQTYADRVRQAVTTDRFWQAAAALVDEDIQTVQEQLLPRMERYEQDLVAVLREAAVDAGEERFTSMPDTYRQDIDRLVTDAVTDAADTVIPTFPFRDDVTRRYDGQDIDPRAIQRHLVRRVGAAVAHQADGVSDAAADLIHGQPVPADHAPTIVDAGPETVRALASPPGQSYLGVRWNSDHPAVQETAAQAFLDDLGGAIQRARQHGKENTAERLEALQDQYQATLDRFRVTETLDALDRYWGTGDMPYSVYEIDDPAEMQRAAADIGNCRTSDMYMEYYEEVAEDPYTTVLGVRRDDEHEWIGVARLFHMTDGDGCDVLAIDNLGMQYKPGKEAQDPESACNFAEYGDALPVMGLASIAYGLEEGFDTVIAGGNDGRVGGGPGDRIGVAQLYSTKNADIATDELTKKGDRDIRKPWGLRELRYKDRSHALLMETPPVDRAA